MSDQQRVPDNSPRYDDTLEQYEDYADPDDPDDEWDDALDNCGMVGPRGPCMQAGTEYCDWDCPFSR